MVILRKKTMLVEETPHSESHYGLITFIIPNVMVFFLTK